MSSEDPKVEGERQVDEANDPMEGADLISMYFEDHDRVKHLYHTYKDPSIPADERLGMIYTVVKELTAQCAAEYEVLVPVLADKLGPALAGHLASELASLKLVMMDLQALEGQQGKAEALRAKVAQLMEILMEHNRVQEHKGLHHLRSLLPPAALQELGLAYQQAKERASTNPAELAVGENQGDDDDEEEEPPHPARAAAPAGAAPGLVAA